MPLCRLSALLTIISGMFAENFSSMVEMRALSLEFGFGRHGLDSSRINGPPRCAHPLGYASSVAGLNKVAGVYIYLRVAMGQAPEIKKVDQYLTLPLPRLLGSLPSVTLEFSPTWLT